MASLHTAALAMLICALACPAAHAEFTVSKKATHDVSCVSGVCTPTAPGANLNVSELTNMLASGDTMLKSGNGNGTTPTIQFADPFSWTSTSRLTLEAKKNIVVKAPVTVAGTGALTLTYNQGGEDGDLLFERKGKIDFWDLNSNLIINGNSYTLVGDFKSLTTDMNSNPAAFYALANDFDGKRHGGTIVLTPFAGGLTGLGHAIANLSIAVQKPWGTFISQISAGASMRDISFQNLMIIRRGRGLHPGALVRSNYGTIENVSVTGQIWGDYYASGLVGTNQSTGIIGNAKVFATILGAGYVGGIASSNSGTITDSYASGSVHGGLPTACNTPITGGLVGVNGGTIVLSHASNSVDGHYGEYKKEGCEIFAKAGGLVGSNSGLIDRSYADGNVTAGEMSYAGGLVGSHGGTISDSYSLGLAHTSTDQTRVGGFVGYNHGAIADSYSVGLTTGGDESRECRQGGLIGCDYAVVGSLASTYWNLDTSGISDPSQGAGDPPNDPGITGFTDAQLKSGLPEGFDPKIWASDPKINNGYPYLRANPPQ